MTARCGSAKGLLRLAIAIASRARARSAIMRLAVVALNRIAWHPTLVFRLRPERRASLVLSRS